MTIGNRDELTVAATGTLPPRTFTPSTILVVDDFRTIRELLARLLRRLGYEVLEAEGALQAQRLAEAQGSIDLLLTDFNMPGMNGVGLAQWFHTRFPRCQVVLTTAAPWEVEPYLAEPHDFVLMAKKDAFGCLEGIVSKLLNARLGPAQTSYENEPRVLYESH